MVLLPPDKVRYLVNPENKKWLNSETDPNMTESSKRIFDQVFYDVGTWQMKRDSASNKQGKLGWKPENW
jgi:hypothetical protein